MIVVKYFHEEPAGLEPLPEDSDPDARSGGAPATLEAFLARPPLYRGYLAATELPSLRTGATAGGSAGAWLNPLVRALASGPWWVARPGGSWERADPESRLANAEPGTLLATAGMEPGVPAPAGTGAGMRRLAGPFGILVEAGCTLFLAEPAPDGVDWAVLSGEPMAARVREAFAADPRPGARRFVIPLREARGEHRFHFERYDPDLYARHEV